MSVPRASILQNGRMRTTFGKCAPCFHPLESARLLSVWVIVWKVRAYSTCGSSLERSGLSNMRFVPWKVRAGLRGHPRVSSRYSEHAEILLVRLSLLLVRPIPSATNTANNRYKRPMWDVLYKGIRIRICIPSTLKLLLV
eukprot:jgi/Botrbrau1/20591/Bobra.113_1s0017.1